MTVTERLRDDHVLIRCALGFLEGALSDMELDRPVDLPWLWRLLGHQTGQATGVSSTPLTRRGPIRENTGIPGGVS